MNNAIDLWEHVLGRLQAGVPCAVLCVVESIGSSPGRRGFKMAVTRDEGLFGSIGGGSMEHKLVELARSLLDREAEFPFLKRQVHQADVGKDRSGMICSGEQTVAFFRLGPEAVPLVQRIVNALHEGPSGTGLELSAAGIHLYPGDPQPSARPAWSFREPLHTRPRIAIVGAGHVSLALSRTMHQLGFHVTVYDDRDGLNTWTANQHAHERVLVDYARIGEHLSDDPELFVVLASFGYRTDDLVLRQLLGRRSAYLGLLGSAEKVRVMFEALRRDGVAEDVLARIHAPVGMPIHSRTPEEIAISIAAEIIAVRNAPRGKPR